MGGKAMSCLKLKIACRPVPKFPRQIHIRGPKKCISREAITRFQPRMFIINSNRYYFKIINIYSKILVKDWCMTHSSLLLFQKPKDAENNYNLGRQYFLHSIY